MTLKAAPLWPWAPPPAWEWPFPPTRYMHPGDCGALRDRGNRLFGKPRGIRQQRRFTAHILCISLHTYNTSMKTARGPCPRAVFPISRPGTYAPPDPAVPSPPPSGSRRRPAQFSSTFGTGLGAHNAGGHKVLPGAPVQGNLRQGTLPCSAENRSISFKSAMIRENMGSWKCL
jgi:hypothetical protein